MISKAELRNGHENKENLEKIGIVKGINIYPVKSMKGQSVESATVTYTGLEGDRPYAFVQSDSKSAFPWLTARNLPEMILYQPFFTEPDNPKKSPVMVRTPEGKELPVDSQELIEELLARIVKRTDKLINIHLLRLGRGTYDALPLSLLANGLVNKLAQHLQIELDEQRFRPNIFVEQTHPNDNWDVIALNQQIVIGDGANAVRITTDLKDPRCKIPNIDPKTGVVNKKVLETLVTSYDNLFGLYATVNNPGTIRVGDSIYFAHK